MQHHFSGTSRLSRPEIWYLLFVGVLSLALRLAYHYEMRGTPLAEHLQLDEQFHDRWAKAIAAGDIVGEGVFFRAPLYPYILAAVYSISGNSADMARVLQHIAGALLVILVYLLARDLFGVSAAVIASLLSALYAVIINFEGRLLFDFPLAFIVLVWSTVVIKLGDRESTAVYFLIGFVWGLICIMRPVFLPLAPLLFWQFHRYHLRGKSCARHASVVMTVGLLVPLLVVGSRNLIVGGDTVLVASQGGINFYIGNNPLSDGMTSSVPEAGGVAWENKAVRHIAETALGGPLLPSQVSAYWYDKAWEFIRTEPAGFFFLTIKKGYLFWSHFEIANNGSYYMYEHASTTLQTLPVGFWLVGSLGCAGLVLCWRNRRARIPILLITGYFLVTILFFVCDRFRVPVIPLLCVLSGGVLSGVWRTISERKWNSLVPTTLLLAAAALLVNTNLVGLQRMPATPVENMEAGAALESGDFVRAAELFARAADNDPGNSSARINQGVALWRMGRLQEAADAFRLGIAGEPYLAQINLAQLYFNLQRADSVEYYAQQAIAARPFAPGGYIVAAKNLLVLQEKRRAEDILLQGLAACREDFVYGEYLLAGIHLSEGRLARADSLYRSVLTRTETMQQPEYALGSEKAQFGEDLPTLRGKSLHAIGRVHALRGRPDSSEVYLRSAAMSLPAKGDIWADWGVALLRLNRLDEADTVMARAVTLATGNPAVWYNYATLLARKGEAMLARQAVERALALQPDFVEGRRLLEALDANRLHR